MSKVKNYNIVSSIVFEECDWKLIEKFFDSKFEAFLILTFVSTRPRLFAKAKLIQNEKEVTLS